MDVELPLLLPGRTEVASSPPSLDACSPSLGELSSKPPTEKRTLVLDLDETLIHSVADAANNVSTTHHRPGVSTFLKEVSKLYELVIFTAGLEEYASPIIDNLDSEGLIQHRLYRQHTRSIAGVKFIKDLALLNRPLARTVIIDNSAESFVLQPLNAIPIEPYFGEAHDTRLLELLPLLEALTKVADVRAMLQACHVSGDFTRVPQLPSARQHLRLRPRRRSNLDAPAKDPLADQREACLASSQVGAHAPTCSSSSSALACTHAPTQELQLAASDTPQTRSRVSPCPRGCPDAPGAVHRSQRRGSCPRHAGGSDECAGSAGSKPQQVACAQQQQQQLHDCGHGRQLACIHTKAASAVPAGTSPALLVTVSCQGSVTEVEGGRLLEEGASEESQSPSLPSLLPSPALRMIRTRVVGCSPWLGAVPVTPKTLASLPSCHALVSTCWRLHGETACKYAHVSAHLRQCTTCSAS